MFECRTILEKCDCSLDSLTINALINRFSRQSFGLFFISFSFFFFLSSFKRSQSITKQRTPSLFWLSFVIISFFFSSFSLLSCASFYLASCTCPRSSCPLSFVRALTTIIGMNLLEDKGITGTCRSTCFLLTADFFVFLSFFLTHFRRSNQSRLCYSKCVC